MTRVAAFVDAGYLFAQGSIALTGVRQARSQIVLDGPAAIAALTQVARHRAGGREFLRAYWYDGASFKGPTIEQDGLAHLDDVQLRLGLLNSAGEQKGVDSLIVTDLIELARLGAIADAVLVSGDEDVRVGVQIAQNYGVRVHLVGISPARGSQSKALLQEADTTTEWDAAWLATFLSVRVTVATSQSDAPTPATTQIGPAEPGRSMDAGLIEHVASELAGTLGDADVAGVVSYWTTRRGVPQELDSRLLGACRSRLGRDLTLLERRSAREHFSRAIRRRRPDM